MCLAPQQRLGLAEGGPSAAHPSWSQASSQMFLAFGERGWGQGRPAVGQGAAAQMSSLYLLLGSWAPGALVLLLTSGQWPVSLGLDSVQNWGRWSSLTLC